MQPSVASCTPPTTNLPPTSADSISITPLPHHTHSLLSNVDISEPSDVPLSKAHAPGASRPYLHWLTVHVDEANLVGLQSPSVSLRVEPHAPGVWAAEHVSVGRMTTSDEDALRDALTSFNRSIGRSGIAVRGMLARKR